MTLIKFVLQPANSPDTNLNDLCFFRSLSKFVQEHEREIEHSAANKDKFWNLIVEQYHKFHSRETLERCWDVKTAVTKCILDANRTNDYKLPHGTKHEEAVSDDISSDLDDTDDPVARTLDYEALHASLPSPSINLWHKLRPPRFALSCNSRKKREKRPLREFTSHESPLTFRMKVVVSHKRSRWCAHTNRSSPTHVPTACASTAHG